MYKRELLSNFNTMNLLVSGEVGVRINGILHWVKVSEECLIEDNFEPYRYVLITDSRFKNWKLINYSNESERAKYLLTIVKGVEPGDKIHLKSINGVYKVLSINNYEMVLTCNNWFRTPNPKRRYHITDFKCKAGGVLNQ